MIFYHSDNPDRPDKGVKGGSCNRTACQAPNSAVYYNKSTKRYYCRVCAIEINRANAADSMELYGTPNLCETDDKPNSAIAIIAHRDEPEQTPDYDMPPPQRTYAGPPIKGKKGRDKRW